jgi:hypothetical protein
MEFILLDKNKRDLNCYGHIHIAIKIKYIITYRMIKIVF